jgi:hypothetical protein
MTEIIGFDLSAIKSAHPEHAELIDKLCEGSNPAFIWGIVSGRHIIRDRQFRTRVQQVKHGLLLSADETCNERDLRMIEEMRSELLRIAPQYTDLVRDGFLQLVYEMQPAYFLVDYGKGRPADKVSASTYIVGTNQLPTPHQLRVLRRLGAESGAGQCANFVQMRLTAAEARWLHDRPWIRVVWEAKSPTHPQVEPKIPFAQLVIARDVVLRTLKELYGDAMQFDTKKRKGVERAGVYLKRNGLTVMITLRHEEAPGRDQEHIDGKPFKEFTAPIPRKVNDVPVEVSYWTLDRDDETV